jgi:hypothetical protein
MTDTIVESSKEWLEARLSVLNGDIQRLTRLYGKDSEQVVSKVEEAARIHNLVKLQNEIDWSFPHWEDVKD